MNKHAALHQLGLYYRKHRKINLMTQAELAAHSGLSDEYIGRLENGKKNPTYITLCKLSEALGLPYPVIDEFSQEDNIYPDTKGVQNHDR